MSEYDVFLTSYQNTSYKWTETGSTSGATGVGSTMNSYCIKIKVPNEDAYGNKVTISGYGSRSPYSSKSFTLQCRYTTTAPKDLPDASGAPRPDSGYSSTSDYESFPSYFSFSFNVTKGTTYYCYIFDSVSSQGNGSYLSLSEMSATVKYTPVYYLTYPDGTSDATDSKSQVTIRSAPATITSNFGITGDGNGGTTKSITATCTQTGSGWIVNGTSYTPGSKVTLTANATATAAYNVPTYSNNSIANLGITTHDSYEVNFDVDIAPLYSTFEFTGWYDSSGTYKYEDTDTFTSETTVYAFWDQSPITLPEFKSGPKKVEFWSDNGEIIGSPSEEFYPLYSPTYLTAIWKLVGGDVCLYNSTASVWNQYLPYIYAKLSSSNELKWYLTIPYIYHNNKWYMVAGGGEPFN